RREPPAMIMEKPLRPLRRTHRAGTSARPDGGAGHVSLERASARRGLQRTGFGARLVAWGWASLLGAGLSSSGCGLDDRDFGVVTSDAGASARGDRLCEGPGCEILPLQACGPECPEVPCPADDACRDYEVRLPPGSCSAEAC